MLRQSDSFDCRGLMLAGQVIYTCSRPILFKVKTKMESAETSVESRGEHTPVVQAARRSLTEIGATDGECHAKAGLQERKLEQVSCGSAEAFGSDNYGSDNYGSDQAFGSDNYGSAEAFGSILLVDNIVSSIVDC